MDEINQEIKKDMDEEMEIDSKNENENYKIILDDLDIKIENDRIKLDDDVYEGNKIQIDDDFVQDKSIPVEIEKEKEEIEDKK